MHRVAAPGLTAIGSRLRVAAYVAGPASWLSPEQAARRAKGFYINARSPDVGARSSEQRGSTRDRTSALKNKLPRTLLTRRAGNGIASISSPDATKLTHSSRSAPARDRLGICTHAPRAGAEPEGVAPRDRPSAAPHSAYMHISFRELASLGPQLLSSRKWSANEHVPRVRRASLHRNLLARRHKESNTRACALARAA